MFLVPSVPYMRRLLAALVISSALLIASTPTSGADDGGISAARSRANAAARALGAAESRLGRLEGEINALEARNRAAKKRAESLRSTVMESAINRYMHAGTVASFESDINRQAKAEALSRYVTQGNQDAIDEFAGLLEDLRVTGKALSSKKAEQQSAVASLRETRRKLESELARLQEIERKRQAAAARARSSRLVAASASRGAPTGPIATGAWICPVQGPHAFSDTWGAPRSGGRAHKGVDILAPRGTPTVAPVGGRVEHRGNSLGGLSWHLYGDDGHYYYGTHLSAYANQGAGHVAAGTVIGYVGDTGNARGTPHLHFEIHPNNGPAVNPYPTVAKYC
jgi:murein DD-endopeptidase MepM/ murein hydrolase activator NlpD